MNNIRDLFIGSTSQLAVFFPKNNLEMISSRNIDISYIKSKKWRNIYIAFANGNTFLYGACFYKIFYATNVQYTLNLIDEIKDSCEKIIYFSTTELWNLHSGALSLPGNPIDIIESYNFDHYSPYINSKAIITTKLLEEEKYNNVIVLFPFSFKEYLKALEIQPSFPYSLNAINDLVRRYPYLLNSSNRWRFLSP